jgi:hypothetical protein
MYVNCLLKTEIMMMMMMMMMIIIIIIIIIIEICRFWEPKVEAELCTLNNNIFTYLSHSSIINNILVFKYTVYIHTYTHFSSSFSTISRCRWLIRCNFLKYCVDNFTVSFTFFFMCVCVCVYINIDLMIAFKQAKISYLESLCYVWQITE